jgi:hypothetical protein
MFLQSVGLGLGARASTVPPDISPPNITSAAAVAAQEAAVLAHGLTADESVTWAIRTSAQDAASVDYAEFALSGSTLTWVANGTKDYSAPDDADANNTYIVVIRATDLAANTTDQTVTVTVSAIRQFVTASGIAVAVTGTREFVAPDGTAIREG